MVKRFGIARMDAGQITPQGFLKADLFATRVGVFNYVRPDGKVIREARLPEEVFHPDSLASLSLAPFTDLHPPELVSASNASKYTRGTVGEKIEQEGDFVKTYALVTDEDLIKKIQSGRQVEVSCGYKCEHDETPGEFRGQPYDVVQRNIRYNHVASVPKGRAGPEVRMKLDAADAVQVEGNQDTPKEETMQKIMIGGKEYEVPAEVAAHIAAQTGELDGFKAEKPALEKKAVDAGAEAAAAKATADQMKANCDSLQAKLDAAKSENEKIKADAAPAEDVIKARVKARVKLENAARAVLAGEKLEKLDALSDGDLMKEVIVSQQPKAELADKSEAYVQARFDSVCESLTERGVKLDGIGATITKNRNDSTVADADKAKKAQLDGAKNEWTKPLSSERAKA